MRHPGCVDLLLPGVDRRRLPDVGHLHRLDVDRLRQLPGEDRRHLLLDVDHLGVDRPDVGHRCPMGVPNACPAGKRTGCYPDAGHLAWRLPAWEPTVLPGRLELLLPERQVLPEPERQVPALRLALLLQASGPGLP